ncbi:MAG: trypsin-like serine protease [Deltaproteobacteria bacterium]|nr:MAG: trypsin-like serine protease [Deltaproteobacteria bacterium]
MYRNLRLLPLLLVPGLALVVAGASGCADRAPVDTAAPSVVTQPIMNGYGPDAPRHAATVALLQRSSTTVYPDIYCSGTLVTPDVVVTAAHCLTSQRGKKLVTTAPEQVAIYFGDGTYTDSNGAAYAAVETLVYPGYDANALVNDIALIRISPPMTAIAPVPVLPHALGFSSANVGETLNFAGFGEDENGAYNTKLQADGVLAGLGCAVSGCWNAGVAASQFSYTQYDSGPCFGDSGGPAFVNRGGTWYLAGVTSYGDNTCTQYGVSTRVDAYEGWIADFAAPAPTCVSDGFCDASCADDPDCAAPTCVADGFCDASCAADPDCGAAEGCGDGVCAADESCDGRYGTTLCDADCAGKMTGKPAGRFCYVGDTCEGDGCP